MIVYLDSSALVKRYVAEVRYMEVQSIVAKAEAVRDMRDQPSRGGGSAGQGGPRQIDHPSSRCRSILNVRYGLGKHYSRSSQRIALFASRQSCVDAWAYAVTMLFIWQPRSTGQSNLMKMSP